ncbi:hypothetical protein E1B28_004619 [Marasmius oreades]|uniref:Mediator of RNA polymerase II transcription subunit 18 n=1 Tax=Marasmius oreades TaxID=181124 RepID=A0A9P7UZ05_9AGAR|nr:uncharacterized protein E1B28_004619 [Marasmius oreades]KAG7097253.1 hypothetical protein E1B28_004619 [Marasmius oreades]
MSSHQYEVALFGEFFSRDLKPILNRITFYSESSHPMQAREIVFEPIDAQYQRTHDVPGGSQEPLLLRARKDLITPLGGEDTGWVLYSYLKPESVRAHPEATVRPWATCHVIGDALSFANALGYVRRSQIYKRGYLFRRGLLLIQMFQQEQVDPKTQKPIPAHSDTLWEVEVKTAAPIRNSQETPLSSAIEQVLQVQTFMKGLLDLRRQDV